MLFSVYSTICLPFNVDLKTYLAANQLESSALKSIKDKFTFFFSEIIHKYTSYWVSLNQTLVIWDGPCWGWHHSLFNWICWWVEYHVVGKTLLLNQYQWACYFWSYFHHYGLKFISNKYINQASIFFIWILL